MDNRRTFLRFKTAIRVYQNLSRYDPYDQESYLKAHQMLMSGLIENAGKYRTGHAGIFEGDVVAHMASPAWNVQNLMTNLFHYLKNSEDNLIIKSCVFHYEMEFIHPFMDGNGRMERLWQTLILMQENPIFEYLPIEIEIKNGQEKYYSVLSQSDKEGITTRFVEYMLDIIRKSLQKWIHEQRVNLTDEERIFYFKEHANLKEFTRKDYMNMFKDISSATASRDLRLGMEMGILIRKGEGRNTSYEFRG